MHHHGQDCLRLKVDVIGHKGSGKTHQDQPKLEKKEKEADEGKGKFVASGGVHNPSNRLSAGENSSEMQHRLVVQRLTAAQLGAGMMKLNSHFPPSDDPAVMEPKVQRSIGNSATQLGSFPLFFSGILVLLTLTLH